jgi:PEP-CTERM motif
MTKLTRIVTFAGVLVFFAAPRVNADSIYNVTGTFGYDFQGDTGLAGGSFTVSMDIVEPINGDFVNFTVSTFDSMGALVFTYSSPTGAAGEITDEGAAGVYLDLGEPGGGPGLNLGFAPGFTGVGPVLPFGSNPLSSAYYISSDDFVTITGGYSSASVPEPSSLILAGTSALAGLGLWSRRRCRR